MRDEAVTELSHDELTRIDALAAVLGTTRAAMLVEIVRVGLPIEEARHHRAPSRPSPAPRRRP